jgi:hypothetical protein
MKQFNPIVDQDDDFQFKPLTEGLGFHKKNQEKSAPKTALKFQTENINVDLTINTPLPRKTLETSSTPISPTAQKPGTNSTVDDILKTLNEKRHIDLNDKKKLHEPAAPVYKATTTDLSAALLDAMLITATTLLCLIILLVVTKVDLFGNLYNPDAYGMVYLSLASLVAGITWIYLVGHRVFLGHTPGEWVFDQRLGRPEEFGTSHYALKAIARSTIVLFTGLVVFPILSLILNRDYLGRLMKLELVRRS